MTEQRKILKKADILSTMTKRATEKSSMMIFVSLGACVPFLVMMNMWMIRFIYKKRRCNESNE